MTFLANSVNGSTVVYGGKTYTYNSTKGTWAVIGATSHTSVNTDTITTTGQIVSKVATGTAPFTVSSTTKVANLNVDQLDGHTIDAAFDNFGSSTIPIRNTAGYLYSNYFNCSADVTAGAATHIAVQTNSDNFIRWQTPAQFLSAPPAIGSTTPSAGSFTTLTANSATFSSTVTLAGTDNEIQLQAITTEPAAPTAGNLLVYSKNVGGRYTLKWKGPSGLDVCIQPLLGQNKIAYWSPPGNSTTVPAVFGMNAVTAVGTATARTVATTRMFTRLKRLGYVSAATAGSLCGHYETLAQYTIGDGTGLGGFYYICRFGVSDATIQTGARMFVGLTSAVAAPTNVEPATLTNCIGVGCGTADTNLKIFYGGSAAQTPIDLGANFPDAAATSTDIYELIMFAPPSSNTTVYYRLTRLNTGNEVSGTLTAATAGTQLPAATTFLAHRAWRATQAAARRWYRYLFFIC